MPDRSKLSYEDFVLLLVALAAVVGLEWMRQLNADSLSVGSRAFSYLVWILITTVAWVGIVRLRGVVGWAIAGAVFGGFWSFHIGSWLDAFQLFVEGELWPAGLYTFGPVLGTMIGAGFGGMLKHDRRTRQMDERGGDQAASSIVTLMASLLLFCATMMALLLAVVGQGSQPEVVKGIGVRESNLESDTEAEAGDRNLLQDSSSGDNNVAVKPRASSTFADGIQIGFVEQLAESVEQSTIVLRVNPSMAKVELPQNAASSDQVLSWEYDHYLPSELEKALQRETQVTLQAEPEVSLLVLSQIAETLGQLQVQRILILPWPEESATGEPSSYETVGTIE